MQNIEKAKKQVMHLLKLREQIVPFDIDFSSSDINLDFRDTRGALSRLLSTGAQFLKSTLISKNQTKYSN